MLPHFLQRSPGVILAEVHFAFGQILKSEIKSIYHVDWLDFLLLSKGAHGIWGRPKYPFKASLGKKLIYKPLDIALKKESDRKSRIQNLAYILLKSIVF